MNFADLLKKYATEGQEENANTSERKRTPVLRFKRKRRAPQPYTEDDMIEIPGKRGIIFHYGQRC